MGAWGFGVFDNDDAKGWLEKFAYSSDLDPVVGPLTRAGGPDAEYLEVRDASEALVAAEALAALRGWPGPDQPESIEQWVARLPTRSTPALARLAVKAVERVQTASELQELVAESGIEDLSNWLETLADLGRRLTKPSKAHRTGTARRAKSPRVIVGDLVAIPVCGQLAVGLVLHVSSYFRGGMLIGVFPRLFAELETIDASELGEPFVQTPNYASVSSVDGRSWRIVGHSDELLRRCTVPALWIAGALYWKDEVVAHLAPPGVTTARNGVPAISREELHSHAPYTFHLGGSLEFVVGTRLCPDETVAASLRRQELLGDDLSQLH